MTRFELLDQIASQAGWFRIADLPFARARLSRESIRIQLHRMYRWGLLERQRRYPWRRDPFAYKISLRGRERLAWARGKGLLHSSVIPS